MRKIVFVINRLAGGGAETQVRRLSVAFSLRGWDAVVVSLMEDVVDTPELAVHGVRKINLQGSKGFRALSLLPALVLRLRREAPSVVVTMMIPADPLTRVASVFAGVPVISSIRNQFVGGNFVNFLLRVTDGLPALVTVNADVTRKELGPRISAKPQLIELVPNLLDCSAYIVDEEAGCSIRRKLGIPQGAFVWLAVGAQRPQKNYSELLRAFAGVRSGFLIIAGAPYQQNDLSELAESLGIAARLFLLGRRSDIPALLSAADAFVQNSLHEGTPNAVLEAMAASRPVVATSVGGVPEAIVHGSSGWLVPARERDTLQERMSQVMELSAEERDIIGARGREYVARNHSTEVVVSRWQELITCATVSTVPS